MTKREPKLNKDQEVEIKKVARQLMAKLKREVLVLNWRASDIRRAGVRQAIREEMDQLLDTYNRQQWAEKVDRPYQFEFEQIGGRR